MKIYIWRHSKQYSSWSMFDEPHVYKDNYLKAEIIILADSKEEALALLKNENKWDIRELERIEPKVMKTDKPAIIDEHITF